MCNCAELDDIVDCGEGEETGFVRIKNLKLLRTKQDAGLYVCPECDCYWHIDHMQRAPQAIKVSEPFKWESFDDLPYRRRFMEHLHGGYSTEQCMWVGCKDQALKNIAFCVHHAYPQFSNEP